MTHVSSEQARSILDRLINQATESREPIRIDGSENVGFLISEAQWRAIQETIHLQSIPGMTESIVEGMTTPIEECSEEPGW